MTTISIRRAFTALSRARYGVVAVLTLGVAAAGISACGGAQQSRGQQVVGGDEAWVEWPIDEPAWRLPLRAAGDGAWWGFDVDEGDAVACRLDDDAQLLEVARFDRATGRVLARTHIEGVAESCTALRLFESALVVRTSTRMLGLERSTLEPAWERLRDDRWFAITDDLAILRKEGGTVSAVLVADGSDAWFAPRPEPGATLLSATRVRHLGTNGEEREAAIIDAVWQCDGGLCRTLLAPDDGRTLGRPALGDIIEAVVRHDDGEVIILRGESGCSDASAQPGTSCLRAHRLDELATAQPLWEQRIWVPAETPAVAITPEAVAAHVCDDDTSRTDPSEASCEAVTMELASGKPYSWGACVACGATFPILVRDYIDEDPEMLPSFERPGPDGWPEWMVLLTRQLLPAWRDARGMTPFFMYGGKLVVLLDYYELTPDDEATAPPYQLIVVRPSDGEIVAHYAGEDPDLHAPVWVQRAGLVYVDYDEDGEMRGAAFYNSGLD